MVDTTSLHISGLTAGYAKLPVLHGIDLRLEPGEVVTVLGANGSGKTTLLNAVCGFVRPWSGSVKVGGTELRGSSSHKVFAAGVVQASGQRELFPEMTVLENLRMGAVTRSRIDDAEMEQVFDFFPRLRERVGQKAKTMSGGEQQMVAIGRALLSRPRILLLDEPLAGLSPLFVGEISKIMLELKARGTTMLLVEQNIAMAARVSDRFYVLRDGHMIAQGAGAELRENHRELAHKYYL
ncbi:branched-chain amino acid transport system ATP-binding protein [Paraburkholderia sp. CI2]|uniref:ABC transporter ATP-binding protein n=1 Tax=unclassified Paraburkholderia TaxID=2615204 RepID=UPI00182B7065|nr:ABC transporter ATP-binding protein [Paraburkholderia sp. CI2]MBB5466782.1 branched-chain amino acid transport system ATP-binding protein [Paraburkholderia sp. CI2]